MRLLNVLAGLCLFGAMLLGAAPAAAQTATLGTCSATLPASDGSYVDATPPQVGMQVQISCSPAASSDAQTIDVCMKLTGGGSRQAVRSGTSDAIGYTVTYRDNGGAFDAIADGSYVLTTIVALSATATSLDTSSTLRADHFATQPQVGVGTYADQLAGAIYLATDGHGCDGSTGRLTSDVAFTGALSVVYGPYCSIASTSTVAFGTLPGTGRVAGDVAGLGGVSVDCVRGTAYTIYLGDGAHRIAGGNRQMANGDALLPYQLYKDDGTVWDETGMDTGIVGGAGGVSATGTGNAVLASVHGKIDDGTLLPATGSYADTVRVTVAY
ncbi:Csu type fimbrial protein [Sphingomonas nostoxanthinifaciens]|uniref:Csu type fimbrial protein n=1 Tax=Sphingomonas nostoxanthinifaciens TaxID=2872652 RepID=UPI001CC1C8F3|nr:spore coat U domain-containing protein [Sphingomonas nostoxanthinifaciens]UAK22989.1 spore coat U domain-containing protein [Sphingomonas nostoxanthinifaciens]